jgi:tRNA(fMet)-specific endonuclease VapC
MMKADQRLLHHVERIGFETVVTSTVVAGELYYGAAKSENVDANWSETSDFLRLLEVIPVSSSIAIEFGRLKAALLDRFVSAPNAATSTWRSLDSATTISGSRRPPSTAARCSFPLIPISCG